MLRLIRYNKQTLKKIPERIKEFLSSSAGKVFFFDEGRFGLKTPQGRCWARKGKRKLVKVQPGYKNFYIYSSVAPGQQDSFTFFLPWVNTEMMNLYLQELSSEYWATKILLIMDQAGWHKSKDLIIPPNIKIEYLPPYSPELNPVERLWQWIKRDSCRNRIYASEEEMTNTLLTTIIEMPKEKMDSLCRCSYLTIIN